MAAKGILYDPGEIARRIMKQLITAFPGENEHTLIESATNQLQIILATELEEYNNRYKELFDLYGSSLEDMVKPETTTNHIIKQLRRELKEEKEERRAERNETVAYWQKQRDDVIKAADLERGSLIRKETDMKQAKTEAQEKLKDLRRALREAREDETAALNRMDQEINKTKELETKVKDLKRSLENARQEAEGWERETGRVVEIRNAASEALSKCRGEREHLKLVNKQLVREEERLKPELERARETIKQLHTTVRDYEVRYHQALDDLKRHQQDSPLAESPLRSPVGHVSAAVMLGGSGTGELDLTITPAPNYVSRALYDNLSLEHDATKREVVRQTEAYANLVEELRKAESTRADCHHGIVELLKPDTRMDVLRENLGAVGLGHIDLRKKAVDMRERFITASEEAACELAADAWGLEKGFMDLYERSAQRLRGAQTELGMLKAGTPETPEDPARHEAVEAVAARISHLEEKNRYLECLSNACQDVGKRAETMDTNEEENILSFVDLLGEFLAGEGPSIEDVSMPLLALVRLQKEQMARQVESRQTQTDNKYGRDVTQQTDADAISENNERERLRLASEVERLEDELQTLRIAAEERVQALDEQTSLIMENGRQVAERESAMNEQLMILDAEQQQLTQDIEWMTVVMADVNADPTLETAERQRDMYQELVETLRREVYYLRDLIQYSEAAEKRARERRMRDRPAPGRRALPSDTNAGGFFRRTIGLLLTTLRYGLVSVALIAMFGIMVVVIVMESRHYAQWQYANETSRALWMAIKDQPSFCLRLPNPKYFW